MEFKTSVANSLDQYFSRFCLALAMLISIPHATAEPLEIESSAYPYTVIESIVLPDVTNDEIADFGILHLDTENNKLLFQVFDGVNLNQWAVITWANIYVEPSLHVLPDLNGNNVPEIGVFGVRTDGDNAGKPRMLVNDLQTGVVSKVYDWPANWTDVKPLVLEDINGDNAVDIAIQGIFEEGARPQLVIRDGQTSGSVTTYSYPDLLSDPEYFQHSDVNDDGVREIATFGRIKKNNKIQVKIADGTDPAKRFKSYNFPDNWSNIEWIALDDKNNDGVRDWGLFGVNRLDGRPQLTVKSGNDPAGAIRIFAWPAEMQNAQFYRIPDMNNDGVDEVAAAGRRSNNDRYQFQVQDGTDRNVVLANHNLNLDITEVSYHVLGDLTGDNIAEIGFFGLDDIGNYILQVQNGNGVDGIVTQYNLGSFWSTKPSLRNIEDINSDGLTEIMFEGHYSDETRLQIWAIPDADSDGYPDTADAFPDDSTESLDTDGDGVGDNADAFPDDGTETVDTDGDGVGDNADAFPNDSTETADTDGDGIGDNADFYENDDICHLETDGNEQQCYLRWMADDSVTIMDISKLGDASLAFALDTNADGVSDSVLIQNVETQHFESSHTELGFSSMVFLPEHNRLYISDLEGSIQYLNGSGEFVTLANIGGQVNTLQNGGNYLLTINNGEVNTVDIDGELADNFSLYYSSSRDYAWNESNSRLYYFRDGISPNDLHYVEIDQDSGLVDDAGETPYHGSYSIIDPIIVSYSGNRVILGSGDIYNSDTLVWEGSLGRQFELAYSDSEENFISITDGLLLREDLELGTVESINIDSQPLALFRHFDNGIIVTQENDLIRSFIYEPNDDSDGDGVPNIEDFYPLDIAASMDSDGDGFPEEWNAGYSETDSSTNLTLDIFPDDSACWLASHGMDGVCDYLATMPEFLPDQVLYSNSGDVFFYSRENNKVYRWSNTTEGFINPISVGEETTTTRISPNLMAYSFEHNRLYFGYISGRITYVDLDNPSQEAVALNIALSVNGLTSVGNYMLAQDNSGAWNTHYIFDIEGNITDSEEWNYYSRTYAWNAVNERVYFLRDGISPNDLHYEEISQTTGMILSDGDSPFHNSTGITHPVMVLDGSKVMLGSGRVFDADTLDEIGALNVNVVTALSIDSTILALEQGQGVSIWSDETYTELANISIAGTLIGMLAKDDDVIVISQVDGDFVFQLVEVADSDGDGLPGWWELKYGLDDSDASDALVDNDDDLLNNIQEFTSGTNPNLADSDGDGVSDALELTEPFTDPLNPDSDEDGLTDGEEINTFLTNPNMIDSDEDGLDDYTEVYVYESNPLSSDTDDDGMGDLWEVNNSLNPTENDADGDLDTDSLSNIDELTHLTDPTNQDSDFDGLSDGNEVHVHNTEPLNRDSDGDKMRDDFEVQYGFDPLLESDAQIDTDSDGFSNLEEYYLGSSPNDLDSIPAIKSWTNYQGNNQYTGFLPIVIDESLLIERWRVTIETSSQQVVSDNGQIITVDSKGTEDSLHSLNPVTGEPLWTSSYASASTVKTPFLSDDRLYLGTSEYLRAINRTNGSLVYRSSDVSDNYGLGIVAFGSTVVSPDNYGIEATNSNGESIWTLSTTRRPNITMDGDYIFAAPENILVLNKDDGTIFKELLSAHPEDTGLVIPGSDQNIVVMQRNGLTSYRVQTGEVIWDRELNNYAGNNIALAYGNVYVSDTILKVYDEMTGELQWSWEAPDSQGLVDNIVVARNLILVSTQNRTYALSTESQTELWNVAESGIKSLSADGALFIATQEEIITYDLGFDQDVDGLQDWWENYYGLDPLDASDALLDNDLDGLTALEEAQFQTDPTLQDSDADGLSDGDEVLVYLSDPNDIDSDDDGLDDFVEVNDYLTDPVSRDTDGDALSDLFEVNYGLDANDASDAALDVDNDGFSALEEYYLNTDINDVNSIPTSQPWITYQANASHNGFVLQTINSENIEQLWSVEYFHPVQQVTSKDGAAFFSIGDSYFGSGIKALVAVDAYSGDEKWVYDLSFADIINATSLSGANVLIQTGGHSNSYLHGISAETGEQFFQTAYGNQWSQYLSPTPYGEYIYSAGGYYGGTYGFLASSGSETFFTDLAQVDDWTPTVNESYIFACQENVLTNVLSRETGEVTSTISNNDWYGCDSNTASVLGSEGNLIAQNNSFLTSYDIANSKVNWQISGVSRQPSIAFGRVYIINDGLLSVYNEVNGGLLWSFEDTSSLTSNIVVTLNKVIVASSSETFVIDIETQETNTLSVGGTLSLSEGILFISDGQKITAFNVDGDEDEDGMPNFWESRYGFDPLDATDALLDSDEDSLSNVEEFSLGTNPNQADTDNDDLADGDEVNVYLSNPRLADSDGDWLSDGDEVNLHMTSVILVDTDSDGFSDGREVLQYQTDPNDVNSFPEAITSLTESFEVEAVPVGWVDIIDASASWLIDPIAASQGSSSLRSGDIGDSQYSSVEYSGLFAAGILSFDFKVDSESCCDSLQLRVDGQEQFRSVEHEWTGFSIALTEGEHVLEWRYSKDGSVSSGDDAAWIDNVVFAL